ncbi:MAG TPA: translesion error-prone DNA polymerase V autoproteolytic subunit [Planctomycetaceae bacterium]|nr:translesion error-prone DNA polymerase V autoproteolytic subunit [Planctomycetaceae bacterium]
MSEPELHKLKTARPAIGFVSPADDFLERHLDLNQFLIQHAAATFFVQVDSEAMSGDGIFEGDILIVDKSLEAVNGSVVIAIVEGEFLVRRLQRRNNVAVLVASNPNFPEIKLDSDEELDIWGVVTTAIHSLIHKG